MSIGTIIIVPVGCIILPSDKFCPAPQRLTRGVRHSWTGCVKAREGCWLSINQDKLDWFFWGKKPASKLDSLNVTHATHVTHVTHVTSEETHVTHASQIEPNRCDSVYVGASMTEPVRNAMLFPLAAREIWFPTSSVQYHRGSQYSSEPRENRQICMVHCPV